MRHDDPLESHVIDARRPRRPATARVCRALVGAALIVSGAACSHDSYLVVTLSGDTIFENVGSVEVDVTAPASMRGATPLLYIVPGAPISFSATAPKTLSISFTPSFSGTVELMVLARTPSTGNGALGCLIGQGPATMVVKKGEIAKVQAMLIHAATPCPVASDGGVTDAGTPDSGTPDGAVTFPGCDPADTMSCPTGQTCFVNCQTQKGMCITGGAKAAGETCTSNADCMPGTQCFDYSTTPGCTAKICLRFCNGDPQCAATTAATGLSLAACSGPVDCPDPAHPGAALMTTYKTCAFACDPRGAATTGCPSGLFCFLYAGAPGAEETPDCGCKESSRVGANGATCASSADCQPGLVCNSMGTTKLCRKLCKLGAAADCTGAGTCTSLSGSTVYGVCI